MIGGGEQETVASEIVKGFNVPIEPPAAVIPVISALLVVKYVAIIATDGTKRHPAPTPTSIPWAKIIW